jgi:ABC-2 type transport system ATP-binding protein
MLSTHIMQEVEAICDRIIIIKEGRIVANDTRENITRLSSMKRQSVSVEFDSDVEHRGADENTGCRESDQG